MLNSAEAESVVRETILARKPASFIRLGDGEGVMLARPSLEHTVVGPYLVSCFGPHITQSQIDYLSRQLHEACGRALVVGIRPDILGAPIDEAWFDLPPAEFLNKFKSTFGLRPAELAKINYTGAYRLALLNSVLAEGLLIDTGHLTTAWCHFDWSRSGFLAEIVLSEQRIGLISRHKELAEIIKTHGTAVDFYSVPPKCQPSSAGGEPHYPDLCQQQIDSLKVLPGQVFLVGAGVCGKVYCDQIASRGGIAIDVGAVCDSWLGLPTRPLVMLSLYGIADVPIELTLARQLGCQPS
ncbi:MAG: hypothetical protein L7S45_05110 [Luminiphilus sp.]|nr:hypothetical protein [Luminiphilus sp.]